MFTMTLYTTWNNNKIYPARIEQLFVPLQMLCDTFKVIVMLYLYIYIYKNITKELESNVGGMQFYISFLFKN